MAKKKKGTLKRKLLADYIRSKRTDAGYLSRSKLQAGKAAKAAYGASRKATARSIKEYRKGQFWRAHDKSSRVGNVQANYRREGINRNSSLDYGAGERRLQRNANKETKRILGKAKTKMRYDSTRHVMTSGPKKRVLSKAARRKAGLPDRSAKRPANKSAAVKKAWATRKKKYGHSGRGGGAGKRRGGGRKR